MLALPVESRLGEALTVMKLIKSHRGSLAWIQEWNLNIAILNLLLGLDLQYLPRGGLNFRKQCEILRTNLGIVNSELGLDLPALEIGQLNWDLPLNEAVDKLNAYFRNSPEGNS